VQLYETRALPALPADVAAILLGTNDLFDPGAGAGRAGRHRDALRALVDAHADGARGRAGVAALRTAPPSARAIARDPRVWRGAPHRCGRTQEVLDLDDFELLNALNASGHAKIAAALADTLRASAPGPARRARP
jgi:lysophospholipase L1-like esterase